MLLIILALIAGALLHAYLACAFAAQFTQQRLLISICAYFVISFIGQAAALASVAIFASNVDFGSMSALLGGSGNVVAVGLLAVLIVCILVDALLWALTQWFMTKRLHLA